MLKLSEVTIINHPKRENVPTLEIGHCDSTACVIPPPGVQMMQCMQVSRKSTQREYLKLQAQETLDALMDRGAFRWSSRGWNMDKSHSLLFRFRFQLPAVWRKQEDLERINADAGRTNQHRKANGPSWDLNPLYVDNMIRNKNWDQNLFSYSLFLCII